MADIDGCLFNLEAGTSQKGGVLGMWSMSTGSAGRVVFQQYKMRGWNTALGAWETWISNNEPGIVPPVGPCTNVTRVASWGTSP